MKGRRGVLLMTVLWIIFLLGLIALGLGRMGGGEMSLVRMSLGRTRAYAAARSGVALAEQKILNAAGTVGMPGEAKPGDAAKAYSAVPVGAGVHVDIGFQEAAGSVDHPDTMIWGPVDEAGRFNVNMINGITGPEALALKALIESVAPGTGEEFLKGVQEFRNGPDRTVKPRPFYALEEILFVPGVTPALWQKLKGLLTVYPYTHTPALKVNVYTAAPVVVEAVFKGIASSSVTPWDLAWTRATVFGPGVDAAQMMQETQTFLQCRMKPGVV